MPNLATSLPSFTITPPFNVLEAAASSSTITVGSGRRLARAARQTIASVVDTPAHLLDPSHLPQVDGGQGGEEEGEEAKEDQLSKLDGEEGKSEGCLTKDIDEDHDMEADNEEKEDLVEIIELDTDGDLPPGVFRPPQRVKHWDPKVGIGVFYKVSCWELFLEYEFADQTIEVGCKL